VLNWNALSSLVDINRTSWFYAVAGRPAAHTTGAGSTRSAMSKARIGIMCSSLPSPR